MNMKRIITSAFVLCFFINSEAQTLKVTQEVTEDQKILIEKMNSDTNVIRFAKAYDAARELNIDTILFYLSLYDRLGLIEEGFCINVPIARHPELKNFFQLYCDMEQAIVPLMTGYPSIFRGKDLLENITLLAQTKPMIRIE